MNEPSNRSATLQAKTRQKILAVIEAEVAEVTGKRKWMIVSCLVLTLFGAWLVLGASLSFASASLAWLIPGATMLVLAGTIPQQIPDRIRVVGFR